jgi:hypothetical protein
MDINSPSEIQIKKIEYLLTSIEKAKSFARFPGFIKSFEYLKFSILSGKIVLEFIESSDDDTPICFNFYTLTSLQDINNTHYYKHGSRFYVPVLKIYRNFADFIELTPLHGFQIIGLCAIQLANLYSGQEFKLKDNEKESQYFFTYCELAYYYCMENRDFIQNTEVRNSIVEYEKYLEQVELKTKLENMYKMQ